MHGNLRTRRPLGFRDWDLRFTILAGRAMQRRAAETNMLAPGSGVGNAAPDSEHSSSSSNANTAGDFGAGQHGGKRQKTGEWRDQRGGGGVVSNSTARKRKRLLADAAKISTGKDSLKCFLELVTCVQAKEIMKVVYAGERERCTYHG